MPDSYWVDETFAAGEYPGAAAEHVARQRLSRFASAGIGLFLDLTHPADGLAPYEHLLVSGERMHRPIVDMGTPTERELVDTLDAIDAAIESGTRLYVHCWGGIGRTGTVVGCWLVRHGMDAGDAVELIRERRQGIPSIRRYPESPQTRAQHRFVHAWRPGH